MLTLPVAAIRCTLAKKLEHLSFPWKLQIYLKNLWIRLSRPPIEALSYDRVLVGQLFDNLIGCEVRTRQ